MVASDASPGGHGLAYSRVSKAGEVRQQEDQEGGNRTFEDDVIPLNNFLSMMAEKKSSL